MTGHNVIIYTSDNCSECEKLVEQMNKWEVDYIERNVSNNEDYLKVLQNRGIFGTPTTFVDDDPVLGFQKNKLKYVLRLAESQDSYFTLKESIKDSKEISIRKTSPFAIKDEANDDFF